MNKYVIIVAKVLLSLPMIVFGANKLSPFLPNPELASEGGRLFFQAMYGTYLFVVIALGEIIGGILLWVKKFEVIGALLLIPITFNIIAFHVAHDLAGLPGPGLIVFLANMILLYAGKDKLKALLQ